VSGGAYVCASIRASDWPSETRPPAIPQLKGPHSEGDLNESAKHHWLNSPWKCDHGQDIPNADLRKAQMDTGCTVKEIQRTDTPIDAVRARVKKGKP
jgi:hypothetical protein